MPFKSGVPPEMIHVALAPAPVQLVLEAAPVRDEESAINAQSLAPRALTLAALSPAALQRVFSPLPVQRVDNNILSGGKVGSVARVHVPPVPMVSMMKASYVKLSELPVILAPVASHVSVRRRLVQLTEVSASKQVGRFPERHVALSIIDTLNK